MTDRGRPVATLGPLPEESTPLDRLVASGKTDSLQPGSGEPRTTPGFSGPNTDQQGPRPRTVRDMNESSQPAPVYLDASALVK